MNKQSLIEEYKRYRKIAIEYLSNLVTEIENPGKDHRRIGRLLGVCRNNTFVYQDANESFAFIDFALAER